MDQNQTPEIVVAVGSSILRHAVYTAVHHSLPGARIVDWGDAGIGNGRGTTRVDAAVIETNGSDLRALWLKRHPAGEVPPVAIFGRDSTVAVMAFDIGAVDFVAVPSPAARVALAVERLAAAVHARNPAPPAPSRAETPAADVGPLLMVSSQGVRRMIPQRSILWIEGARNYIRVHLENEVVSDRATLNQVATMLRPSGFVRVHRSAIVNLAAIREVGAHRRNGERLLTLTNGDRLLLSRTYAAEFRREFGIRTRDYQPQAASA